MTTIIFKLCSILFLWVIIPFGVGIVTFSPFLGLIAFIVIGVILCLMYKQIFNWVVPDAIKIGYKIGGKVGKKVINKIYKKYGK